MKECHQIRKYFGENTAKFLLYQVKYKCNFNFSAASEMIVNRSQCRIVQHAKINLMNLLNFVMVFIS